MPSSIYDLKEFIVIYFAGESIGNRNWSNSVKQEILNSRINTTRSIVNAINDGTMNPKVLINASDVGYYGPRQDDKITESEGPGQDFLSEVCWKWEDEAYKDKNEYTRIVKRPSWFPVPEFMLKIALGQMSEMLLHGQRAIPQKISDTGFEFKFPELRLALENVLGRECC